MQLIVTPKASKQLNRLPKSQKAKIIKKLSSIENNYLIGKKLTGELKELWSARAWPYRIIYLVELKKGKIFVVSILHRQGAYK